MKKTSLLLSTFVLSFTSFAQDKSANQVPAMLPEAGDIGVGFDAMPFVEFVTKSIGGSAPAAAFAGFATGQNAIWGKYFLDEKTAVRAQIRPGFGSVTTNNTVSDDNGPVGQNATVTDTRKQSYSSIALGGGLEMRRGKGRIQGFYGGELLFSMGSTKTTYQYGNLLTSNNTTATFTTDFDDLLAGTADESVGSSRVIEESSGAQLGVGARGFVGVEWFIAKKVSLAFEYGWGLSFQSSDVELQKLEAWQNGAYITSTDRIGSGSSFGVDTDISGAALRMMFHF